MTALLRRQLRCSSMLHSPEANSTGQSNQSKQEDHGTLGTTSGSGLSTMIIQPSKAYGA